MVLINFDANAYEPISSGFDPLPAGTYTACITTSEMRPTKAGNGAYLQLEFEIIDGPHRGRRLWDRLLLQHPSADAVRIATGKLSSICRAVGVMTPKDSSELHNKPLAVVVRQRVNENNSEVYNEISSYKESSKPSQVYGVPSNHPPVTPPPLPKMAAQEPILPIASPPQVPSHIQSEFDKVQQAQNPLPWNRG